MFCLFEMLRMQPADGNPEGLGLQPVKSCFKLTVSCSEVIVDYDLIEKVAVLALHHMGRFNHFVKIFFLVKINARHSQSMATSHQLILC